MSRVAIRAERLSKRYRLGEHQPHLTLREVLSSTFHGSIRRLTRRRPGPSPDDAARDHDGIWALKDVSFEVQHGDVMGIIGRNGAGKSTLLKIISRITRPTRGYAEIHGRVGSLLEVGTGFHPDLTGRENIFLNGAVLGMKKTDIERRFDEIVAFSELESFLDTPVKRYSSGMYMRLAFAVAAHLEPDILVVDEVLAVGDQAFQNKCLGKMDSVRREGRTVLLVSHTLDTIRRLCSRCILFDQGRIIGYGSTADVVAQYQSSSAYRAQPNQWLDLSGLRRIGSGGARFVAMRYSSLNPTAASQPYSGGPLELVLAIRSDSEMSVGALSVQICTVLGTKLVDASTKGLGRPVDLNSGLNLVTLRIERLHLTPGPYRLGLRLADPIGGLRYRGAYDYLDPAFEFEVFSLHPDAVAGCADGLVACDFSIARPTEALDLPDWLTAGGERLSAGVPRS